MVDRAAAAGHPRSAGISVAAPRRRSSAIAKQPAGLLAKLANRALGARARERVAMLGLELHARGLGAAPRAQEHERGPGDTAGDDGSGGAGPPPRGPPPPPPPRLEPAARGLAPRPERALHP